MLKNEGSRKMALLLPALLLENDLKKMREGKEFKENIKHKFNVSTVERNQ